MLHKLLISIVALSSALVFSSGCSSSSSDNGGGGGTDADGYAVVDTDQVECFNNLQEMNCPGADEAFFGQDAQYESNNSSYTDNGDGTVTDNVTGLMWQQDPGDKMTWDEAVDGADSFDLAGYSDWRLPTIKELYSLILFSGEDPSGETGDDTSGLVPFIDTDYFDFKYGDTSAGERVIDSQWTTNVIYNSTVMNREECFFGVNFADGRIKCYPTNNLGGGYFTIYVRNNSEYGDNGFQDNGDGTITDSSTGLMWMQYDSGYFDAGDDGDGALDWEQALAWMEDLAYAGHEDWRLPNAKELQSIVDYYRSPDTTDSPAIDSIFDTTSIIDEAGETDYPYFWTGTTHETSNGMGGYAVYVAFGRAMGYMNGQWIDVHGAGAQRSDLKSGDPADYPEGQGPQGDAIRIYNYVRGVRDAQ